MKCNDSRKCFAKSKPNTKSGFVKADCAVLRGMEYSDGKCPFCKEYRDWSDGEYYPYEKEAYYKRYQNLYHNWYDKKYGGTTCEFY